MEMTTSHLSIAEGSLACLEPKKAQWLISQTSKIRNVHPWTKTIISSLLCSHEKECTTNTTNMLQYQLWKHTRLKRHKGPLLYNFTETKHAKQKLYLIITVNLVDIPLGVSVIIPECGWHHTMGWNPQLDKKNENVSWAPIFASLLPEYTMWPCIRHLLHVFLTMLCSIPSNCKIIRVGETAQ